MNSPVDVKYLVFRYPNHKVRVFHLRKLMSRRDALLFIGRMSSKGLAIKQLSFAGLENGWCV